MKTKELIDLSEVEYVILNNHIQYHRYSEGLHKMAALKSKQLSRHSLGCVL